MISVHIDMQDNVSSSLQALGKRLRDPAINHVIGGSASNTVQEHFQRLDTERANDMGAPRSHFYADAARGTNYDVQADGVFVFVFKTGIRQRYHGGTITPVNSKYLTLPARAEAYGRRAREFDDLEVLYGRNGPYALAQRAGTSISFVADRRKGRKGQKRVKRGADRGGIFYWLVKSVTQQADPFVLPDENEMRARSIKEVERFLMSGGGQPNVN